MPHRKLIRTLFGTVFVATTLATTVANAEPPQKLTGTVKSDVMIQFPFPAEFEWKATYNILQLDPETGEAFGMIITQATQGFPQHGVITVSHMNINSGGAWICGTLTGRIADLVIEDPVPVVTAVVDSGKPGGQGDVVLGFLSGEPALLANCGNYPVASPNAPISVQSIADDANTLLFGGAPVFTPQVLFALGFLNETKSGNLKAHP